MGAASKTKGKSARQDADLASRLASEDIVATVDVTNITLALSTTIAPEIIVRAIDSIEVKSLIHELLALRLVGDPDHHAKRIESSFRSYLCARISLPGQREVDRVALVLFQYINDRCAEVVSVVSKGKKDIIERIKSNANYSLIRNTLNAIERHCEALAGGDEKKAVEFEKFVGKYRKQVVVKHGSIVLPDFERKRRFPVEDLYVDARLIFSHDGEARSSTLSNIQRGIDRTVILGDPGGGKSTAAAVLAHRLAQSNDDLVPFLIILRDFPVGEPNHPSILEFIEMRLNSFYQVKPPPGAVEMLLLSGKAQVIFDGLDELIDTSRRREVTDIVEMFCSLYPLARVLVTSREVGYQEAPVDDSTFDVMRITRFSDDQVREYVSNWFERAASDDVHTPADLARSFMEESSVVSDLRGNPLMLSLMCIMYRGEKYIPRNRPELYEKCATMLFDKWDSSRRIYVDVEVAHLVDVALKHLAWWIFTRDDSSEGVREHDLVKETTQFLLNSAFEHEAQAKKAAQQFISFCKGRAWVFSDAGTTADGESLYKFTHRTFLEYFTAYELSRRSESSERLARQLLPRISKGEWDVVAQLAVQIENKNRANGANRILEILLTDKIKRAVEGRANVLAFICRCLDFHVPAPQLVRDLTARVAALAFERRGPREGHTARRPLNYLLLMSSQRSWEIVEDQLTTEFKSRIESSSPEVRTSTWFMLLGLVDETIELRILLSNPGPNEPRWLKWRLNFIQANWDSLEREAFENAALRAASVFEGCETIDNITKVRNSSNRAIDRYRSMFHPSKNEFYGWARVPGAYWIPYGALTASGDHGKRCRAMLRTIGMWGNSLPEPPWLTVKDIEENQFLVDDGVDYSHTSPLADDEFVGAALLVLPPLELRIPIDVRLLDPEFEDDPSRPKRNRLRALLLDNRIMQLAKDRQLGTFNAQNAVGIDGMAGELLRAWARNEVSFVATQGPQMGP
ncbi:NACHT domain-containing protein [Amycolatopsis orientalis]|uniref:NACHT domain-containing protein n=1 Tax=Amycolatopsis orientalis TaxID=31958 RepID=UPI0009E00981|nr:NACHT domain-containing protein [Amycolatopsis orientalis]